MVLCGIRDKKILTTFGHLPEYPTCSKAVRWYYIRRAMNFAGSVEPSLQYGSLPCRGFLLFGSKPGCIVIMHPFISDWVCIQGRIIPKVCFGFPSTFHRTVLSYYGRQVGEACYLTAIYGVKDSLVRAIIAED